MAARGLRDLDSGAEPVSDPAEREFFQGRARAVHAKAIAFAAVLTATVLLIP